MSSTARGGEIHASSYYRTPRWCTKRWIESQPAMAGKFLEPTAGDGAIIRAFSEIGNRSIQWTAVELRPEEQDSLNDLTNDTHCPVDFLEQAKYWKRIGSFWDRIITNPPFPLAFEMLKACLALAPRVTFLQRLNWLESEERVDFFRDHMPDVAILPNRPCFTLNAQGKAATDSCCYAWMSFIGSSEAGAPIPTRRGGQVSILASSSKEERRLEVEELMIEQRRLTRRDA